jgi:hypothetical protein
MADFQTQTIKNTKHLSKTSALLHPSTPSHNNTKEDLPIQGGPLHRSVRSRLTGFSPRRSASYRTTLPLTISRSPSFKAYSLTHRFQLKFPVIFPFTILNKRPARPSRKLPPVALITISFLLWSLFASQAGHRLVSPNLSILPHFSHFLTYVILS